MEPFVTNIEKETRENEFYRRVLFTGSKLQLVVMSLKPGEDIPTEMHEGTDQFIRVESGHASVRVDGAVHELRDDDVIIIPAGTEHYVKNASDDEDLKVYTLYATPEHPTGTLHKTQVEASRHHD